MLPVFFSRNVIVLDCGASCISLGVFREKGGRLGLNHWAIEELAASSSGEDQWLESVGPAFRSLRARLGVQGPVVLTLPASLTLTKMLKVPCVEPAQREKIVRFEAGQNIPYALTDVVWDSIITGERGGETEILLAAAKQELVERLCAAAAAAGFEPHLVLPPALGMLAGFRRVGPADLKNSLVLNVGERSTTLWLIQPGRFILRTFSALHRGANPPRLPDQTGKTALGAKSSSSPASQNTEEAGPGNTHLLQEINRTVLHFQGQGKGDAPDRVFLSGRRAGQPGLEVALAAKLQVPVAWIDLTEGLEMPDGGGTIRSAKPDPVLADLAGVAAARLYPGQPLLNLLPPARRRLLDQRRRRPWLIAAVVLFMTMPLPALLQFRRLAVEAEKKTAAIERALDPLRQRDSRNRANLQRLDRLKRQIALWKNLSARRTRWPAFLADLQDRLVRVEDVWLESLRIVPEVKGQPLRLVFSGRMLDRNNPLTKAGPATFNRVKALLASLAESPYVTAVEAERFDGSQPGMVKFDFVLIGNPQRPL